MKDDLLNQKAVQDSRYIFLLNQIILKKLENLDTIVHKNADYQWYDTLPEFTYSYGWCQQGLSTCLNS